MDSSSASARLPADQDSPTPSRILQTWFLGFCLATFAIWLIGLYFVESLPVFAWDEALGRNVYRPGSVIHWRTEGWSSSTFGRHQMKGIPDIEKIPGPKVLLWGDSHVEGKQVEDEESMALQVTRIMRERHGGGLTGAPAAEMGRKMADCYFLLPAYEKVATPVLHHFFILHGLDDDITPDGKVFLERPSFRFVERKLHFTEHLDLKNALVGSRLEFMLYPAYRLRDAWVRGEFRFGIGPVPPLSFKHPPSPPASISTLREAWTFVVRSLKDRATAPIAFVYTPPVPSLRDGKILLTKDDEILLHERTFAAICRNEGVGWIDLTEMFLARYRATGQFPYGFHNGFPTSGHLNANGHRWVAEAICDFLDPARRKAGKAGKDALTPLQSMPDALHAD